MTTKTEADELAESMRELQVMEQAVATLIATLRAANCTPSCVLYVAGKLIDCDAATRRWSLEESAKAAIHAAHLARRMRLEGLGAGDA